MDVIQDQWQLIMQEFPTFLTVVTMAVGGVAWVLNHRYSGTIESLREQREQLRSEIDALKGERTDLRVALDELEHRVHEMSESFAEEIAKRPRPEGKCLAVPVHDAEVEAGRPLWAGRSWRHLRIGISPH